MDYLKQTSLFDRHSDIQCSKMQDVDKVIINESHIILNETIIRQNKEIHTPNIKYIGQLLITVANFGQVHKQN